MSHDTMNRMKPERYKNLMTRGIINAWEQSIRTKEMYKARTRPYPERINHRPLYIVRTGSQVAYRAIWARCRERVIGERVFKERVIRESVATCRFAE